MCVVYDLNKARAVREWGEKGGAGGAGGGGRGGRGGREGGGRGGEGAGKEIKRKSLSYHRCPFLFFHCIQRAITINKEQSH